MEYAKIYTRMRKGLNLIEAAMVLAIAAVVIAGVMLFYQSAATGNNLNKASGQVVTIMSTVKQLYSSSPTYTGLTNAAIFNSIPRDMQGTSPALVNSFGGAITMGTANSNAQATVTLVDVPKAACPKLASMDFGSDVVDVLVGAQTASGTAAATPTTIMAGGRPSTSTANTSCSGDYNTVRWAFR